MRLCTRKIEFDAAHRIMRHESKCKNLHGHRYVVEITASSKLDDIGRVIDFSVLKKVCGGWVEDNWDHGIILNCKDIDIISLCAEHGWKGATLVGNPTAENMAEFLFNKFNELLGKIKSNVEIVHIRLHETPNCWADYGTRDLTWN